MDLDVLAVDQADAVRIAAADGGYTVPIGCEGDRRFRRTRGANQQVAGKGSAAFQQHAIAGLERRLVRPVDGLPRLLGRGAFLAIGPFRREVIGLGLAADVAAGGQHDHCDQHFTDHRR